MAVRTRRVPKRRAAVRARAESPVVPDPRHEDEIERGLELHDARKYAAALKHFERAHALAPLCPLADYNRANTLHQLGRDDEATEILEKLIATPIPTLKARCVRIPARALQVDAYYLLFLTSIWGKGFSAKAFKYADQHIRRRRPGTKSIWSLREVRADVAEMRAEWKQARAGDKR
jgi:tetratricopeptide (TPR) repeat protein